MVEHKQILTIINLFKKWINYIKINNDYLVFTTATRI